MRIHYFQHVSFEGLGKIKPLLERRDCQISGTHWYAGDAAPDSDQYDLLIVMGGPMGVYDYSQYPWLELEKKAIKSAIAAGKRVLGVCLGAQLIASTLGSQVSKNPQREIGWFDVQSNPQLENTFFANIFPERYEPLHWHGDTFARPKYSVALGHSAACEQQGFVFDDRVVALQFHLELDVEGIAALCDACGNELDGSTYVQEPAGMLAATTQFDASSVILKNLITRFLQE